MLRGMTIATYCREQLLTHGPLSLDDLTDRAVEAGVTRAKNPHASVSSALRQEIQLLDGRWVTPLWLLEGRCLTAASLPYAQPWYGEIDPDLGLLGDAIPSDDAIPSYDTPVTAGTDDGTVLCVRVHDGQVTVTRIPCPSSDTPEVAALAERLAALTPRDRYGQRRAAARRALAQLVVDDPSAFSTPLPPVSSWVPALVEDARLRDEEARRMAEWHEQDERRRARQVVLDDCTAVEVQLAAERAFLSVREWVLAAIDRALSEERTASPGPSGLVISLGDRWSRSGW
jgi:hypothetical protein